MSIEARRLSVPFNALKPARVGVWLFPSTAIVDDVPLAVLVDFDDFVRRGLPAKHDEDFIAACGLTDRREWAQQFGVNARGRLVTYADLSHYGWGLKTEGKSRASYWTVFFAQNVMRGLSMRLIGCEMAVLYKDAQGEEVYFQPWIKTLRKEVKAYKRIKPVKTMSGWIADEVDALWGRVARGLTQEVNRKNLAFALRKSSIVEFNREQLEAERRRREEAEENGDENEL